MDRRELEREIDRLTDHWVDALLVPPAHKDQALLAQVSRFVVDVERFEQDAKEPMAARGMGVIYTRMTDGRPFRVEPGPEEREWLLQRYYRPHHQRLSRAVADLLRDHGRALILDLHSFPSEPLPCDSSQTRPRPDVCIGTDSYHTPPKLVDALQETFLRAGYSVRIDEPYAGTLVPMDHYGGTDTVHSVMIEINRRLYMDERDVRPLPDFDRVGEELRTLVLEAVRQA